MSALAPIRIDGLIYAKQAHGGISRNFTNLINALAERDGSDVELCLEEGLAFPEGMSPVRTRRIPGDAKLRPSRLFRRLSASLSERRRHSFWSSMESGVFHSSFYSSPSGLRVPQVLSMHDVIFEDYPQLFSTDRHVAHLRDKEHAFRHCDAIVFPSEFARTSASAHYDLSSKIVQTIPHAIDARFRRLPSREEISRFRERVSSGRPFLLHVGSRYFHKNVARLLEAYRAWNGRAKHPLVLAGGGALDADESRLIATLGIGEDVIVLPRMSDEDLLCAYHAAKAFVFPSFSEGFGFPLLEALACGCPAACANAASLPEVGGDAPVYFDPMAIESIVSALTEVVTCADDRDRWESARTRAQRRTWAEVADDFVEIYAATGRIPRSRG